MSSRRCRSGALLGLALALAADGCSQPRREPGAALARERLVSLPSSIAHVSSARSSAGLSADIRFGGPLGRSALYLKFPGEWRTQGIPVQAFLTLSPREASPSSDVPLTLEAWRISADWRPQALQHWSDKPSLAPPYARVKVTSSPIREVRIDVTELVLFAARNPERDFGIAVIASGNEGPGESFSTGLAGGRAPRLELYLR
ncbi:MAG TPA: hypothetical protein VEQ59_01485 [Polyangiaceae bacterium]|nr:hypothetical protein [Polyangiaceae bacterium]